jgi:predicted DNA-binding WGR domain protein
MKQAYLENTIDNHDKFYHMMENKDGVSFTASWGKIGSDGRSYVYDMSEWDNKYQEKINKGYENISGVGSNVTPPSNWIQGMSVAQRKKQGITTVQPFYQPSKSKKETVKKVHYNVGQVDVEVNHSHQNKLRILKMTMENWSHDDGKNYALDSRQGRLYEADLYKVTDLMDEGREILTKEEMIEMNDLFKAYGGERITQQ